VYFQNQYINIGRTPSRKFADLLAALRDKVNDQGIDAKVILRDLPNTRRVLEALEAFGFEMSRVRVQRSSHTKGIVVDGEVVLLGSHNWSDLGATRNRDASLIFFDPQVAGYSEKVFEHDWAGLARQRVVAERAMPRLAPAEGEAARGLEGEGEYHRIPWGAYFED
jgi:phosphatidylserine/phosphatidylglycerophosphate/cardiolipin synthase-like enzyme